LEPIMKIEIECPSEFQGTVSGDVVSRRGLIVGSANPTAEMAVIEAEVPLAETFGYATDLRSQTQGQGTYTMELRRYKRVPYKIQETIVAERKKADLVGAS